uniref:Uncharacterized protein n=1 Tax=Anguilla anguilla TaxID=7936 RepID=A0A0E9XNV9_ANGAN
MNITFNIDHRVKIRKYTVVADNQCSQCHI